MRPGVALERAEALQQTQVFNSGEWFTTNQAGAEIGIDQRKLMGALVILRDNRLVESRKVPGMDGQQWRKRRKVINPLLVRWDAKTLSGVFTHEQ